MQIKKFLIYLQVIIKFNFYLLLLLLLLLLLFIIIILFNPMHLIICYEFSPLSSIVLYLLYLAISKASPSYKDQTSHKHILQKLHTITHSFRSSLRMNHPNTPVLTPLKMKEKFFFSGIFFSLFFFFS